MRLRQSCGHEALALQALQCCPDDLAVAIDFCFAHRENDDERKQSLQIRIDNAKKEMSTLRLLRDSCVAAPTVRPDTSSQCWLDLLSKAKEDATRERNARATALCKRRLALRIASVTQPVPSVLQEYRERAVVNWAGSSWDVIDLGVLAGRHTNACFWLCLAAGWSRCPATQYGDADLQRLHDLTKTITLEELETRRTDRDVAVDQLGRAADALRQFFCGRDGYMFRNQIVAIYAPIFAACHAVYGASDRYTTLESYKRWIGNVARGEFADELILAAVAKCLQLCITTVPHTPFGNTAWAIAQHPMEELWPSLGITHEIVMGNNDVHYVWLTRDDMPP